MRLITKTDGIMRFLAGQPTDKICAVLAHAEDGKLAYMSCCCLIGSFTAEHPLSGIDSCPDRSVHYVNAKKLPYALAAEVEFCDLGSLNSDAGREDAGRRRRVIPLLRYELRRRELQAGDVGEAGQPTSRKAVLAK